MSHHAHRRVTVVMYHFVRDLERSRFPEIKGLSIEEFRGQVDYFRRYYTAIGVPDLLAALESPDLPLPPRALLLTFDDGYVDHFDTVLPILDDHGFAGCFFPPAKAVTEHQVLDVNKIHFVLAAVPDKSRILDALFAQIDTARGEFPVPSRDDLYEKLAHPNRFDNAEVMLIKRLLQRELPEALRKRITAELFRRFVTDDEVAFSQELYMDTAQLRMMRDAGMHIGSHGYDHYWLDTLDQADQIREVELSLEFLRAVGADIESWVMGYPYGAYDESLLRVLGERGCKAGFTTEVRIADVDHDAPLTLPRLDTNDLPKRGDAIPSTWTVEVSPGGAMP